MTITTSLDEPLFALGFRLGADTDEEPPALEFQSRVLAFQLNTSLAAASRRPFIG
jgi:hypothetical protein